MNRLTWCGLMAVFMVSTDVLADPTALINIDARDATDLSGKWHYIVDPLKTGVVRADSRRYSVFRDIAGPESQVDFFEYNFDAAPECRFLATGMDRTSH